MNEANKDDFWFDKLVIAIGIAERVASDTSTAQDLEDAGAALASIDRTLAGGDGVVPEIDGAAGALRNLRVVIADCIAGDRGESLRMRLRSAIVLTKERCRRSEDDRSEDQGRPHRD